MNTCGQCQHYGEAPTKGPICTKTGKEVSFLQAGKSCWEERAAGPDVITKVCSRCHRSLALTEFSRNHSARDGYQHECKDCQRELAQAYMAKKDAATSPPPDQERKTKRCPKCGRELPLERFGKNKRTTDGLKCYCKECENKNSVIYRRRVRQEAKAAKEAAKDITLVGIPDADLVAELKRRGYVGTISKNHYTL
jgi:hypothetical protein